MSEKPAIPRRNNFDLLRLILASTVGLVHCYELSAAAQLKWISDLLSPPLAVQSFFVVSGFLVFMSYDQSSSLFSYASKRVRRIYPAYAVVILTFATALYVMSTKPIADYFSGPWVAYIVANMTFLNFLHPTLPGVFQSNLTPVINGAIWTLKIEVIFYLAVPLLFLGMRKLGSLPFLIFLYVASVLYTFLCTRMGKFGNSVLYEELARQFPGQLKYFAVGSMLYIYFNLFSARIRTLIPSLCIFAILFDLVTGLDVMWPIALGTGLFFVVFFKYLGNAGRFGDFSYGIYILHFPIIQTLIAVGLAVRAPTVFLGTAIAATSASAFVMWHLVEKRFLTTRSHYLTATVS